MATFIDGIAASENIDSSGERISIAGMDISSLALDGVFTYEHEQATGPKGEKITIKLPEQTVGKILKAKKIFSEEDCEDERELYFWQKVQVPYIYVMGELFDDYTDAAKDLAGKFRYDADRKGQNERTVMNFSIEGSYIARNGIEVVRSVARKCTITPMPCNKAAVAEMVPNPEKANENGDIDSLFKTEVVEIELLKTEKAPVKTLTEDDMKKHADALGLQPMAKNVIPFPGKPATSAPGVATKAPARPLAGDAPKLPSKTNNPGSHIGTTKSGKQIFSHAKIHEYSGFSSADHMEAANFHYSQAQAAKDPAMGKLHMDKMNLHRQAAVTAENREKRFGLGRQQASNKALGKSLTADSGNVAPSQLSGGAALAKESLNKKKHWLARAEEAYNKWDKRDEFRSFMQKRLPNLAMGEIDAIGKTIALKKSIDAENKLSKLVKKK